MLGQLPKDQLVAKLQLYDLAFAPSTWLDIGPIVSSLCDKQVALFLVRFLRRNLDAISAKSFLRTRIAMITIELGFLNN